ncbi:MAG: SGNH/GDSL hydrolase family protein [Steroidobacteraceae bacterium]|nr:SGNH/GDSL hydrolase family protein [Steroidobacteraceae bacterium]
MTPGHIALLGDSIFDNGAYTAGAPDVVTHLRSLLPAGWRASLVAVDGSTTSSVPAQMSRVPADATHLVLSVGGNDALENSDLLASVVGPTTEALGLFDERVSQFEQNYRAALERVLQLRKTTAVCTIYNGNLAPSEVRLARIALMLFNDAILRVACEHALPVLDLRLICTEPADYANPIEPSGQGGRKIALGIAGMLGLLASPARSSRVYGGSGSE